MSAAMYAFQRRMRTAHALDGYRPRYGHVLLALATYADASGVAAPSREVLATVTGQDSQRVKEALIWGGRRGLIRRVGGGYRGRAAEYVITPERGTPSHPQSDEKGVHEQPPKGYTLAPPYKKNRGPSPPKAATAPAWTPDEDPEPDPWPTITTAQARPPR